MQQQKGPKVVLFYVGGPFISEIGPLLTGDDNQDR
jgi:hypothetical protein